MGLEIVFSANVIGIFGPTDIVKTRPWYGKYLIGKDNNFPNIKEVVNLLN